MKHIYVAAAVIIRDNKVFAAKRKNQGELALAWEFPGGKIEKNESAELALIREIQEELATKIAIEQYLLTVEHQYKSFFLTMEAYLCTIVEGNLELHEHIESRWLSSYELYSVDWAAADIPIVDIVATILGT